MEHEDGVYVSTCKNSDRVVDCAAVHNGEIVGAWAFQIQGNGTFNSAFRVGDNIADYTKCKWYRRMTNAERTEYDVPQRGGTRAGAGRPTVSADGANTKPMRVTNAERATILSMREANRQ